MAAKKKVSIPIKDQMSAIDRNDFDFYSRLDKEHKKAFSPWITMRCASSAQGVAAYHYLLMVNDIVNVDFSLLKKHPELQWKLLAVCGQGSSTYHPWIAPVKKRKKDKLEAFLSKQHPTLSKEELELLVSINSEEDLKNLARDTGLDEKEIKELFK
jgi:hypothetical protein